MISHNLEDTIRQFLLDNEYFDSVRNRTLVRSGFLNCRDGILAFINGLVESAEKRELTEEQKIAIAVYKSLAEQLRDYGVWVYVDNPSTESSVESSVIVDSQTAENQESGT